MSELKWDAAFGPLSAALLVTGFKKYERFEELRAQIEDGKESLNDIVTSKDGLLKKLEEATLIRKALSDEAVLSVKALPGLAPSGLEFLIDNNKLGSSVILKHAPDSGRFTRSSLARWFCNRGEIEKSKILDPSIQQASQHSTDSGLDEPVDDKEYSDTFSQACDIADLEREKVRLKRANYQYEESRDNAIAKVDAQIECIKNDSDSQISKTTDAKSNNEKVLDKRIRVLEVLVIDIKKAAGAMGIPIDVKRLPFSTKKIFELLKERDTKDCFRVCDDTLRAQFWRKQKLCSCGVGNKSKEENAVAKLFLDYFKNLN
jgi:hypothetical protein